MAHVPLSGLKQPRPAPLLPLPCLLRLLGKVLRDTGGGTVEHISKLLLQALVCRGEALICSSSCLCRSNSALKENWERFNLFIMGPSELCAGTQWNYRASRAQKRRRTLVRGWAGGG